VTDAAGRKATAISIAVPQKAGGLSKPSLALCNQLRVVDRARLQRKLGTLDDQILSAINDGLRVILDL
jgi:mRNA interferase MazF